MKLAIRLRNDGSDAEAISRALRETSIEVKCEAGKVVLFTEQLVPEGLDPKDDELVQKLGIVFAGWSLR